MDGTHDWALEEFGRVELGDRRREDRCVRMAAALAAAPAGHVSDVFARDADRQGAYDFLENTAIRASKLGLAASQACAERCRAHERCLVAIDGTSLQIVDRGRKKDFGVVGSYRNDARGLKVISAMATSLEGEPLGLLHQHYWTRPTKRPPRVRTMYRKLEDKETRYWLEVINEAVGSLQGTGSRPWFVIDREGDCADILLKVAKVDGDFTVRSRHDRRLAGPKKRYLVSTLRGRKLLTEYSLEVAEAHGRRARTATMHVRSAQVELDFFDHQTKKHRFLTVWAVLVEEKHTTPRGEKPIQWLLLSNQPAETADQARSFLNVYALRWQIEEFHKTWKSGQCCVEDTQLHTTEAVWKWAILHAAVAVRTERLKNLARITPSEPASIELTQDEIRVLVALKHRIKNSVESVPNDPNIGQAVTWIAQLGGYTGKYSGGPPGSKTIARGFEKLLASVEAVLAVENSSRMR